MHIHYLQPKDIYIYMLTKIVNQCLTNIFKLRLTNIVKLCLTNIVKLVKHNFTHRPFGV